MPSSWEQVQSFRQPPPHCCRLGQGNLQLVARRIYPNSPDEICFMRTVDIMDAIRRKKLSAREVMQAHLRQIDRVNPKVNAIVTRVPEDQLMAQAAAADEALAHGKWLGPLHGLPVGVKDLHET